MDGIHDLGGKHGFGTPVRETVEPAFHERWEASVFVMIQAAFGAGLIGNTDRFRHAIERIDPVAYLTRGYYGRWLGALETMLVENGDVTQAAIDERTIDQRTIDQPTIDRPANAARSQALVAARPNASPNPHPGPPAARGSQRPVATPAQFAAGDMIRTISDVVSQHTRLPAYARDKPGRVLSLHAGWVYPDTNAHGKGEHPQHLYTVAFAAADLWGAAADPALTVCLDLFEPYLRTAQSTKSTDNQDD